MGHLWCRRRFSGILALTLHTGSRIHAWPDYAYGLAICSIQFIMLYTVHPVRPRTVEPQGFGGIADQPVLLAWASTYLTAPASAERKRLRARLSRAFRIVGRLADPVTARSVQSRRPYVYASPPLN